MNRRRVTVADGVVRIEQRIQISKTEIGTDVSGPACIFARVEVADGGVAYVQDDAHIGVPRVFAIFLPPFTIVQASLQASS